MALAAAFALALGASGAGARGLHLETPAWYEPTYVDTSMTLVLGVSHFRATTDATSFFAGIAPLRRGPLEFGVSIPYIFLRSPAGAENGAGDPRVDARLRLPLPTSWFVRAYVDASARLPTSSASLFPYASGAQDIEIGGTLALRTPLRPFVGVGRIFAEPPRDTELTRDDVPHSTHVWAWLSSQRGAWWAALRGDALLFAVEDERRGVVRATLGWHNARAFFVLFDWSVDIGTRQNRVFDHGPTLRFATPLL